MPSVEATRRKKERERRRAERTAAREVSTNGKASGSKKPKSKLREWAEALFFAVVVMLIVRTLFFDLFRIPTPSMEKSLLVGDYLFVSKLHYGTRTPISLGIPFTQNFYLHGVELPHTRLPGFSEVERGDAVVFNYPVEDKPIDRRMHYIKRVMGLPGETIEVRDKVVYIDGQAQPFLPGMQILWNIVKKDERLRLSEARLRELGVTEAGATANLRIHRMLATEAAAKSVAELTIVERVEPAIAPANAGYGNLMYPPGRAQTPDNFGPLHIPRAGETVPLNNETWPVYETVITRYEGHTARRLADGTIEIDGQPATEYTFEQDYYFMMGDNRDNSEDSRFWGFVPFDHVVGKAVMVYFSWDALAPFLEKIRFGRMFRFVE